MELEMLGWPVSAHPLHPFVEALSAQGAIPASALGQNAGREVMAAGARLSLWGERRGQWLFEDETALFAVRLPPGTRLGSGSLGKLGPYRMWGQAHVARSGDLTFHAERIEPL